MSSRVIQVLSVLSGALLVLVGILFPLAIPLEPRAPLLVAYTLASREMINYAYVAGVVLSNVLFAPLLVLFTIRLYRHRQGTAILAGSFLGFALVLETVAVLISLSRWQWIIPVAAKGEPNVLLLFQTFQTLWLMLDLPGALLFYVAAIIYAIGLWRLHQTTALLFTASTAFFVAAGAVSLVAPAVAGALVTGSIVVYGIAYIAIGQFILELGKRAGESEAASVPASKPTPLPAKP